MTSGNRTRAALAPVLLAAVTIWLAAAAASARAAHSPVASAAAVCRVPHILGLERFFANVELIDGVGPGCPHLKLGPVTVRRTRRHGPLIVVSQTPRPGAPAAGHRSVAVTLAPAPPLPRTCRAPALYELLADTHQLVVWRVTRAGSDEREPEEASQSYYACVPPDGHKRKLTETGENGAELVSAGSFAAFTDTHGNRYGGGQALQLEDVLTGRRFELTVIAYGPVGNESPPAALAKLGEPVGLAAEDLAVDASGDLAWVGESEGSAPTRRRTCCTCARRNRSASSRSPHESAMSPSTARISRGAPKAQHRARRSPRRRRDLPGVGSAHRGARRCDIHLRAQRCAAWLYQPEQASACVVLAHGWTGVREQRLDAFAERFAAAGFAALVFDYRHFGASDGEPRSLLDIKRQREDWRAAVAYARGLDRIDPERIALWGSSFSGGHVIETAARDHRVAAVIAQVPFIDGFANLLRLGRRHALGLTLAGLRDQLGVLAGRPPHMLASVGPPGSGAVMDTPTPSPASSRSTPTAWSGPTRRPPASRCASAAIGRSAGSPRSAARSCSRSQTRTRSRHRTSPSRPRAWRPAPSCATTPEGTSIRTSASCSSRSSATRASSCCVGWRTEAADREAQMRPLEARDARRAERRSGRQSAAALRVAPSSASSIPASPSSRAVAR